MTRELTEAILAEVPEAEVEAVEGDEGMGGNILGGNQICETMFGFSIDFQTLLKWRSTGS